MSPAEAKRQLRAIAQDTGLRAWVQRRPYAAMGASFLLGAALASDPPLRRTLVRLLLSSL